MTAALRRSEISLAHYLPWWWLDNGVLVSHDGALSLAFELTGIDPTCFPDEQVNLVAHHLRYFLNALPVGLSLQFLVRAHTYDRAAFTDFARIPTTDNPILLEQRHRAADHLAAQRMRRFDTYLVLTQPKALGRLGSHFPSALNRFLNRFFQLQDPLTITREQHERAATYLRQSGDTFTRYLANAGVQLTPLDDNRVVELCYALTNPTRSGPGPSLSAAKPQTLPDTDRPIYRHLSLREQLADSAFTENAYDFFLGDPPRPHRIVGLKSFPPRTIATLAAELQRIPFDHWLSVGVSIPDSERAFGNIERRRNRAQIAASGFVRDVRASQQAQELEAVMDAMVGRDQRVFQLSLHVLFGGSSVAELDTRTREVIEVGRNMSGTVLASESMNQLPAFQGMLPGAVHRAPHSRSLMTDNAADFLPIYRSWPGDRRPLFTVQTRKGEPFSIDLTDPARTNWNSCVFGQSGGGKTFLVLSLLTSSAAALRSPVIVIDVGGGELGSYYRLCKLLGGDFVDLSLDGANAINPFFSRRDLFTTDRGEPSKTPNELKLSFLTGILSMLVSEPGRPPLTTIQEGLLQRATLDAYNRLRDERPPLLSDVAEELRTMKVDRDDKEDSAVFAKTLRSWIEGPYGRLLNQQSKVSIRSDFVVFDVKGIENVGRLASVLIAIVSAYVWNQIAKPRSALAWIVYDECWKLLQNPKAADLISELYRTARKLNTGVLSVTQRLQDFLASPASEAILANSSSTFLLKHKDGHHAVAERVGLNDRELELFKTLVTQKGSFAEFFYKTENGSAVLRNSPSPMDYWVNTTDPRDRDLEARVLADCGGDRLAALRRLARDYPNGASSRRST
jgi:type IV secretory pathway VirB4 component